MDRAERDLLVEAERIIAGASSADIAYFAEPDSAEARLYAQRRLVAAAAGILDVSVAEALENSLTLPTDDLYVWRGDRAAAVFIDHRDGSHLRARRGLTYEAHLTAFVEGVRS